MTAFKGSTEPSPAVTSTGARSRLFFFQKEDNLCFRLVTGESGGEEGGSSGGTGVAGVVGLDILLKRLWLETLARLAKLEFGDW